LSGFAQERRALTLDGIILLIRAGTSSARVSQLIEKNGVVFELDEGALRKLREAEASEAVLSAVKKMAAQYTEEQQRQRREATAAAKAEQERQEKEAKARVERERREKETAAKAERERQQKEAAAKAEQERQEKEAKARVERERREKEAAAKAERERQQKEAAAKAEQERQEKEAKARVDRERREREAAAKGDSQIGSLRPGETPTPLSRAELKQLSIIVIKRDLKIEERLDLTVKGQYSDGTEVNLKSGVQWKSSDPSVASVNTKGEVQALKEGSTRISAIYQGVSSGPYTFNVKANEESRKAQESGGEIKDLRRRLLR
jgi:multidrug efflux pump subunit AcrA (membrane-fusion protein)